MNAWLSNVWQDLRFGRPESRQAPWLSSDGGFASGLMSTRITWSSCFSRRRSRPHVASKSARSCLRLQWRTSYDQSWSLV